MLRALLSTIILFTFWCGAAVAADEPAPVKFSKKLFIDASRKLSIDELQTKDLQSQFKPYKSEIFFDSAKGDAWVTVSIKNPDHQPLLLKIGNPNLTNLQLYEANERGDGYHLILETGVYRMRPIQNQLFYLPLSAPESQKDFTRVYLRASYALGGAANVPIEVMTRDQAFGDIERTAVGNGIYYGIILVMMLYNASLFLLLRDRVYFFYTLFILSYGFMRLGGSGMLGGWSDTGQLDWRIYTPVLFGDLNILTVVLYSREFLGLAKRSPRLAKFGIGLCVSSALAALAMPWLPLRSSTGITFLLHMVALPYLLVVSIDAIRKGYQPARLFLAGLLALIMASAYVTLILSGAIPSSWGSGASMDLGVKIGSTIELVMFSFALASRIRHSDAQKNSALESLLRAEVLRREAQEQSAAEAARASTYMAIANMIQSLAHDIRKPFSMLKMGLNRLAVVGDNPGEARSLAKKINQHVGLAFDDVNRMIADVLEVGGGISNLHQEALSLNVALSGALTQTFRYHQNTDVVFHFDFKHAHRVLIDSTKVPRVFNNILDNARQAMGGRGHVWIRAHELPVDEGSDLRFIEIGIRNSGPAIPPEDLRHLFDAFFTKGKSGGTGLGLAIADKIVSAHGGLLRCLSDAEVGTEFIMTLPAAEQLDGQARMPMPASSRDIADSFERSFDASA